MKNINKGSAKKAESLFIFYSYFNLINLSISSATSFACAAALTTVSAPVTTSPDANTPSFVVCPLLSVINNPHLFISRPVVLDTILFLAAWLIAIITESHSNKPSVPSLFTVIILPLSSSAFS